MRMWIGISPKELCNKHLLGEHGEIHKHKHNFEKHHSIAKRVVFPAQIVPAEMQRRHDDLAIEMIARAMNHQSPYNMPSLSHLSEEERNPSVDTQLNRRDLANRCEECAKRMVVNNE